MPECDDDEDAEYKEQCSQLKVIALSVTVPGDRLEVVEFTVFYNGYLAY